MSDEKPILTATGETCDNGGVLTALPSPSPAEILPGQKRSDVILFMVLMSAAAFVNGYAIPETNQTADLLNTKYGWTGDWEKSWH